MRCAFVFAGAAWVNVGAAAAQCADGQRFGDIGVTRIACSDCTIAPPTSRTPWRFRSEPSIAGVAAGSPAEGRLQVGDVITAVNGEAITSEAGAQAFARLHPTQPVALTIRRDGATHNFLIPPRAVCASPELLGMNPGGQRVISSARYAVRTTHATEVRPATAVRSRAWVGIAFSCHDCGVIVEQGTPRWSFSTPPEVYSVETGSPAYTAGIRRGDVLTHVDELAITSAEGGRRWASLEPGKAVRVRYTRKTSAGGTVQRTARLQVTSPRAAVTAATQARAAELRAIETTLARTDTAAVGLLRTYDEVVRRQQSEQERVLAAAQSGLTSTDADERRRAQAVLQEVASRQEMLRAQQLELRRRTSELQETERQRTEESRRVLEELLRSAAPGQAVTVYPSGRGADQRLRYSGTLRGAEIEVRGVSSVTVTERGNEIVITTHDSTIIVRVPDRD